MDYLPHDSCYVIAGIKICIHILDYSALDKLTHPRCNILQPTAIFAYQREEMFEEPDMDIFLNPMQKASLDGIEYISAPGQLCYEQDDYYYNMYLPSEDLNDLNYYTLMCDKEFTDIAYIPHAETYSCLDLGLVREAFEARITRHGGFVLHGAALEWNGKGIIFSGSSGVGKSTQAHLWKDLRGAFITNGDTPAIKIEDGKPYMYGTPWCGSSGESIDRRTHVDAIVMLEQAKENSVRRMGRFEAFELLLTQVCRPFYDRKTLSLAMDGLDKMLDTTPVFMLSCTPDENAVLTLEKELEKLF